MAKQGDTLAPLLAAIRDLVAWLQESAVPGTIIGGVAASLLGRPRVTRDIDALVMLEESKWAAFRSPACSSVDRGVRHRVGHARVTARF